MSELFANFSLPCFFTYGNFIKVRSLPDLLQCHGIAERDSDIRWGYCLTFAPRMCQHEILRISFALAEECVDPGNL